MICYSCGKEIDDDTGLEMQVSGRILIGYDCPCGYTTYDKYLEKTPPEIDTFENVKNYLYNEGYEYKLIKDETILVCMNREQYIDLLVMLSQVIFLFYVVVDVHEDTLFITFRNREKC